MTNLPPCYWAAVALALLALLFLAWAITGDDEF